jgi:hypothetical protein
MKEALHTSQAKNLHNKKGHSEEGGVMDNWILVSFRKKTYKNGSL